MKRRRRGIAPPPLGADCGCPTRGSRAREDGRDARPTLRHGVFPDVDGVGGDDLLVVVAAHADDVGLAGVFAPCFYDAAAHGAGRGGPGEREGEGDRLERGARGRVAEEGVSVLPHTVFH